MSRAGWRPALALAVAALLLLGLCAAPLHAQGEAGPEAPAVLGDADFGWSLLRADGDTARLAEFRGRVLFINIWATWCGPCVKELPAIEALRDSVPGVEFLAVSPERPERARAWLAEHRIGLPVFFDAGGRPEGLALTMVPTTFVVDRAGVVVLTVRGAVEWDRPEPRAMLRALLQAAPDGAGD